MITKYITDSTEAQAAITSSEPKNIWVNGSETWVCTGEDYKEDILLLN